MPIKVKDETTGDMIDAFTAEDLEAAKAAEKLRLETEFNGKLKDKDEYVNKKLDEFVKGGQARDLKDKEWEQKLEDTRKLGEEGLKFGKESEQKRQDTIKNFIMEQYGGNDPEIKKKLEEGYALINKEIKTDDDIAERMKLAANMVGINSGTKSININAPMFGGYAPKVTPPDATKEQDFKDFKEALDLGDILPDKKE